MLLLNKSTRSLQIWNCVTTYFLIKRHTTKTFGKVELQLYVLLISALVTGEWLFHASTSLQKKEKILGEPQMVQRREKSLTPARN
jgi:hypothetical protein